jgi:hypothetical protein
VAGLSETRRSLDAARSTRARLEFALAEAVARVDELRRDKGADADELVLAEQARARAEDELSRHREATETLRGEFRDELVAVLGDRADDFAGLDAALPLVLLPVRLETRFRGSELLVRVYPDEIAADSHEPELTPDERDLGFAYWRAIWTAPTAEAAEWRRLLVSMSPQRAAWVVERTQPANVAETPHPADPIFPDVALKTDVWTRATDTRVLPDRWIALGFRGGQEVARAVSGAVLEPLVLSLGPRPGDSAELDLSGDGLHIDAALAWTMDFAEAEKVGMGFRLPLNADIAATGLDELLVLGVKGSLGPDDVRTRMTELIDGHHYERGLCFVKQGTPTNNTAAVPAGYPPDDRDGALSFAVERGPLLATAGASGDRLARALGVAATVFDHVDGTDRDEQAPARAMCDALWPATWGYFLEQLLLAGPVDLAVLDSFRRYFVEHVRGRGHHPAFRIGSTPYGLLVASSFARWKDRVVVNPDITVLRGAFEAELPGELQRLVPIWNRETARVPRAGRSADADADLVGMLEMDASAREIRVRSVIGATASFNVASFLAADWEAWSVERARLARDAARVIGRDDIASRVYGLTYGRNGWLFDRGFVVSKDAGAPEPLSETAALDFNYIRWIRTASLDDLQAEQLPAGVVKPTALLYLMLRHAFLREVADAGDRVLVSASVFAADVRREVELVGMSVTRAAAPGAAAGQPQRIPPAPTIWTRLGQSVPNVTGTLPLSRFLLETTGHPSTQSIEAYRASLEALENLPTAELERLFTETLDLCSHRLDAWILSLFAERLAALRQARPDGAYLGAYGRVEDLRPAPAGQRTPIASDRREFLARTVPSLAQAALEQQVSTGGHIHAPSMTHAAAAAVLRNGYLSRHGVVGETGERYAVNLSSSRVRDARWLLDAVRSGQTLGAVLGYQFERGLHEGHRPLELDKYIEPVRTLFPLEASKLIPAAANEAVEAIAARNVVDGLALHTAFHNDTVAWGSQGLPALGTDDQKAIEAELVLLDESLDALADLLTAESVYQLVRGATTSASATLDSLARGVRPPDPEVAESPRGGSTVRHRVLLVLGGDPMPSPDWNGIDSTPRSRAEPVLDGWLGNVIGDPARVRCRVTYTDIADASVTHTRDVSLADLALRPIDVLVTVAAADAAAQTSGSAPTTSAQIGGFDAHIAWFVLGRPDAAADAPIDIAYEPTDRDALRSFPEIATLVGAVSAFLAGARPLEPRDLLAPDRSSLLSEADAMPADAATRADAGRSDLDDAIEAIDAALAPLDVDPRPVAPDLGPLRRALVDASYFGIPGALPDRRRGNSPDVVEALIQRAKSVGAELTRRQTAAVAAATPVTRVAAVFGDAFKFMPRFKPAPTELDQALAIGPTPRPDEIAVRRWLHGAALVRPALGRYKQFAILDHAHGGPLPALAATQVPHRAGTLWVAEPFGDEEHRPPSGVVSLALVRVAEPGADDVWTGVMLDEWTELIPNREESTAVAFHYDDPGAEAPQAVLVAVPPGDEKTWSLDMVAAIVHETFELAQIRAVDAQMLPSLSQLLPAAYVAANPKRDTVSTSFAGGLVQDFVIQQP